MTRVITDIAISSLSVTQFAAARWTVRDDENRLVARSLCLDYTLCRLWPTRKRPVEAALIMVALCNRADHYIFALWFLSIFFFHLSFIFLA